VLSILLGSPLLLTWRRKKFKVNFLGCALAFDPEHLNVDIGDPRLCGPIVGISNSTSNRDHWVGLGIVSSE
jgi:hypothetical protein